MTYDTRGFHLFLDEIEDIIERVDLSSLAWNHNEHGDGALTCVVPTRDSTLPVSNLLKRDCPLRLVDGATELYRGFLQAPVPSDVGVSCTAQGVFELAKADATFVRTLVDASLDHWHDSEQDSRMYTMDETGQLRVKHERGHAASADNGAGIYYWLHEGKRTDLEIHHVEFGDSNIDVDDAAWYAKVQFNLTHPWDTFTTEKSWHNETASGAKRVPPGTDSFADVGHSGVQCLRIFLVSNAEITAAECTHGRWVTMKKPRVYVTPGDVRVDEVLSLIAQELGVDPGDCVTVATGSVLTSPTVFDDTDRADAMSFFAALSDEIAEWCFRGGKFYCNPRPAVPPDRRRWFVVDSQDIPSYGVTIDDESRVEYVCVRYLAWDDTDSTFPDGKPRQLYLPEAPPDTLQRVARLDLTAQKGAWTAAEATAMGDLYLELIAGQLASGPIGLRSITQTVDGIPEPSCHILPGDFVYVRDKGLGPLYITAVEHDTSSSTVHVGNSETDFSSVEGRLLAQMLGIDDHRKKKRKRKKHHHEVRTRAGKTQK